VSPATVPSRTLRLACPDGLVVGLDVRRPAEDRALPLVLVCHGFKGFRRWGMFPPLAERLAASGRVVVTVDLSHNGTASGSEEEFTRLDLFERQTMGRNVSDLVLARDELLGAPFADEYGVDVSRGVGLVAHSMGSVAALLAAAGDDRTSSLVTLNGVARPVRFGEEARQQMADEGRVIIPNARTGQDMPLGRAYLDGVEALDLEAVARKVDAPALVIVGAADPVVDPTEADLLVEWLPHARKQEIPGGDHTLGARHPWQGWTPELERAALLMDAFLPRSSN
jgi:pimeloyl-ACP methyl ester carboxylesterase